MTKDMAQVIVDSMTYDEICELFKQDANLMSHKVDDGQKKFIPLLKNSRSKERTYSNLSSLIKCLIAAIG